ncbi:hypothetical protein D3C78_1289220 [compost metagenome]
MDGRGAHAARPPLSDEDRLPHPGDELRHPQAQGRRQQPGTAGRQDPAAQRDWRVQPRSGSADSLRPLRGQPRYRRLHRHRPAEQPDRRRRHAALRPAPRAERALAGHRRRWRRPRHAQESDPAHAVVHRPVRRRQVDHRQPGRTQAARPRPPHLPARRRQRAPRPEPRPGLQRSRPGGEHPPGRRGGTADARRRADHPGLVHLAVPRRTGTGAQPGRRRRLPGDLRRHAAGDGRAA